MHFKSDILKNTRYRLPGQLPGMRSMLDYLSALEPETGLHFCRPGLRYGPSPIKAELSDRRSWIDRVLARCLSYRKLHQYTEANSSEWLNRLSQRRQELLSMTPQQVDASRATLVQRIRHAVPTNDILDEALVHVAVVIENTKHVILRANQCLAARAMLQGHCVEMATGEGKTLSIALAAGAAALSGTPVHVLTANNYLATRDAEYLTHVYQCLGLQVASATPMQEPDERRNSYSADVVYVTAKQVAFDWLNDTIEMGTAPDSLPARLSALTHANVQAVYKPMLRGLCLAILDEADSLLVDEARIPLVLAKANAANTADEAETVIALGFAEQLREGVDYRVQSTTRMVQLTEAGCEELSRMSSKVTHVWQSSRYREERVGQALTAIHSFVRDRDYIVRNQRLELMDAHTGRATPDRRLPHGLHRMLEIKEKCKPSAQHETIATIPFQHFFRHYIGLAGISGTLLEVSEEIQHIYNAFVVPVPSHCPSRRHDLPATAFADRSSQLQAMVNAVQQRHVLKQPVLICTRSVEQSLGVSAMLTAHDLSHQVLNAYQDADEAGIVASAGQAGQLTVATNMAGRGTDIPLGSGVAELGGLHVISLAFNDARRLDRQLAGRAARQGDPGSYQQLLSLDDSYLVDAMPAVVLKCAAMCVARGWQRAALLLIRMTQRRVEKSHRKVRLSLYQSRQKLERQLAFAGKSDQPS